MAKEKKPTIESLLLEEIKEAEEAIKQAKVAFDYANEDFIEIAIEDLHIAELKLDNLYKKAKILGIRVDYR